MSEGKQRNTVFDVFTEIAIINQLSQNALQRVLPDGLRMAHFGVLSHFVRRGNAQSPSQLATAFQITKGAMTNTLKRLSTRGLVCIATNPQDGRAKLVTITQKGKAMHARALKAITPVMEKTTLRFKAGEFEAILPILIRLRETLDTARN